MLLCCAGTLLTPTRHFRTVFEKMRKKKGGIADCLDEKMDDPGSETCPSYLDKEEKKKTRKLSRTYRQENG